MTVRSRTSRCSSGLIQNAGNSRWVTSASKQTTYQGAYTKLLLQAHCSQVSQCARASVINAKTHHSVGDGGRERVSWIEQNFNISEWHTTNLLPAHSLQLVQCVRPLRSDHEPKRWVHTSMKQHAQVSELDVSGSQTRQHAIAPAAERLSISLCDR